MNLLTQTAAIRTLQAKGLSRSRATKLVAKVVKEKGVVSDGCREKVFAYDIETAYTNWLNPETTVVLSKRNLAALGLG